jgi:hypothetical protein
MQGEKFPVSILQHMVVARYLDVGPIVQSDRKYFPIIQRVDDTSLDDSFRAGWRWSSSSCDTEVCGLDSKDFSYVGIYSDVGCARLPTFRRAARYIHLDRLYHHDFSNYQLYLRLIN